MLRSKCRVLVVDDQASARYLVVKVLHKKGYSTVEASSAEEAIEVLERESETLDGLILDWQMSGHDGLWLIRWMKAREKYALLPVVLLTAFEQERDMAWGIGAGANQYVTKPFHGDILLNILQTCIGRYHQVQSLVAQTNSLNKGDVSGENSRCLNQFFVQSLECKNRKDLTNLFFKFLKGMSFPSAPPETDFSVASGEIRISLLLCFGSEFYLSDREYSSSTDKAVMRHCMVGGEIVTKDQATIIPAGSSALIIRNTPTKLDEQNEALWICQGMLRQLESVDRQFSHPKAAVESVVSKTSGAVDIEQYQRMMRFAQKTAHLGVIELNLWTKKTFWSQGAKGLLEIDEPGDDLGLDRLIKLTHQDDRFLLQSVVTDLSLKRRESARLEIRLICKDSSHRFVQVESHVSLNAEEGEEFLLIMLYDITWLKTIENQLRQSYEESQISGYGKSVFLAHLSHEIRTPLNGILGVLQVIGTQVDGDVEQMINGAEKSCQQLVIVLNQLLDLAHSEYQKFDLKLVEFNADRFERFLPLYRGLAIDKGLSFECENQIDGNTKLQSDPKRICQALSGLIENAIKFTEQGSVHFLIALERGPKLATQLYFEIRDTGIGIEQKNIERVFGPFVQVDEKASRRFEGLGLGLTLSQRLIEALEGKITIESELGKGCVVKVWIPVAVSQGVSSLPKPLKSSISEPKLRVLLADDHRLHRVIGAKSLMQMNHQVHCVDNGQEAVDWLLQNPCDLVLMDAEMPVMDGFLAISRIRNGQALQPDIPIFLVVGPEPVDPSRLEGVLVEGLIHKPYSAEELQRCCKSLVESR